MTPSKNIFCNSPWYELHIYWDGGLGICCQESRRLYDSNDTSYNIKNITIAEWFNSDPVKAFRQSMLGNTPTPLCQVCYNDEKFNGNSRRYKSNQKSVIFLRKAFNESFRQSPGYPAFKFSEDNNGETFTYPIDIHVDFGNFCNLACKMCNASASSTIAAQEISWGNENSRRFLGTDWTRDKATWESFKKQIISLPKLNNIHIMGGETLATNRLDDLVDSLIDCNRTDVCISFVTNGTFYRPELMEKLKRFRRVGIEISIETVDVHNSYVRQGTDTELVLKNIENFNKLTNDSNISITLRPAPSLLSVGYFHTVLDYALVNNFIVKCNYCYYPDFLNIKYLPDNVKLLYQPKYIDILSRLSSVTTESDFNASNPTNVKLVVKNIAETCLQMLQTPAPDNSPQRNRELIEHCKKWDKVYNYNARELYPELSELFDRYGY